MNIEKIESLGCFEDKTERALPTLEGLDSLLVGSYLQRAGAVRLCAEAAYRRGFQVFAVQNGGQCFSGPEAHVTYDKYGSSIGCHENGRGGPWANEVYEIKGTV